MVNANRTALVGVRVLVEAECSCAARNFDKPETCRNVHCYNGGRCLEGRWGVRCQCPRGFDGPRCQQTTRTFHGRGWAWYPPLELCEESHLSVEFLAKKPEGVILYNGPIVPPEDEELLKKYDKDEPMRRIPPLYGKLGLRWQVNNSLKLTGAFSYAGKQDRLSHN